MSEEELKVQSRPGSLVMDREFNPIARFDAPVPAEIRGNRRAVYLSGTSLVLEDTDDIIHQAEREALEELRSDKAGSFENDDGCHPSEPMRCLLGSMELFFFSCCREAHRWAVKPVTVVSPTMKDSSTQFNDGRCLHFGFCWINRWRKAASLRF